MLDVSAIVLCGGLGTRLRPVIKDLPKCLAPVNNRSFLFYILDQLVDAKVKSIVLAVNYLGEMVEETVGTKYKGIPIYYSHDKIENGGTGHAARMAAVFVETEDILIMNGDTYIDFPLHNFIFYGRDLVFDEVRFVLNVRNGITNMGVYYLNKELLIDVIPKLKSYSLEKSLLSDTFEDEPKCFLINSPFIDIGTPESYASANEFMREFAQ